MPDAVEIILEEARRKFDGQGDRLTDLRSRAGALLASAAVVTSLFGFRLGGHHSTAHLALIIAAIVAFGVVGLLTLAVNLPVSKNAKRKKWTDGSSIDRWLERLEANAPDTDRIGLELARELNKARKWNESIVSERMTIFRWSCVAFGLEVSCWAIAVGF